MFVGSLASKSTDDFRCGTQAFNRVQCDDFRVIQVQRSLIGILVKETINHFARKITVFRKVIAFTNIFSAFGLERPITRYVYTSEVPNTQMILRSLKVRSPATVKDLAEWMRKRDVRIPDIKWLQRKLDSLRKHRLAVRMDDGTYAITEESLRIIPGDRSRSSSDVERALVLSRVTW